MSDQSLISVIVPCYNQGKYLAECLMCLVNQTYQNWECLIINDGSADDTEKVATEWIKKDPRFKYFFKKNGGLSSARNQGLAEATGDYIQFLDADDLIDPEKFSESMKHTAEAKVIISNFKLFRNKVDEAFVSTFNLSQHLFNFKSILTGWDTLFAIPIHCAIFKKDLFSEIKFDEELKAKEDWLMWIQIYASEPATYFLDKPYAFYRQTDSGMTKNRSLMYRNLILVYKKIYQVIPSRYKDDLFIAAVDHLGLRLLDEANLFDRVKASESYKAGNFIVGLYKKITLKKKPL